MAQLGFTFYPKDWWTSDSFYALNPFERYIYLELLFMMYDSEGSIKNDKIKVERRLGTTIKEDVWSKITDLMVKDGDQLTHNSVNKRLSKAKSSRENGNLGGRPKGDVDIYSITGKKIPSVLNSGHFVYLIYDSINDEYKIGETQNLKKRRQTIKRPSKDLSIYHFEIYDAYTCQGLERKIINDFADQRISGDWFKLSKNDLNIVLDIMRSGEINLNNRPNNPPLEIESKIEIKEKEINKEKVILKNGQEKIISQRLMPFLTEMLSDDITIERICMNNHLIPDILKDYIKQFFVLRSNENNQEIQVLNDAQSYFSRWLTCELQKNKQNEQPQKTGAKSGFKLVR